MKDKFILSLTGLFVILIGCTTPVKVGTSDKSKITIECNNTVCDTITTYRITRLQGKDTLSYNFTYRDTIELKDLTGEIQFENFRCKSCKGKQTAYIANSKNAIVDSVLVIHNGNAVSEKILLKRYESYFPGILKIQWEGFDGKSFYIKIKNE